jgi:hypothetical protein
MTELGLVVIGGTKAQEISRSLELFEKIYREQGLHMALYFLVDSQYGNAELKLMAECQEKYAKRERIIREMIAADREKRQQAVDEMIVAREGETTCNC